MSALWAAASDPFVGKWKLNPSKSKMIDQMKVESLGANKYSFDFGGGAETILADGTDQPGNFGTTLSVTVDGPNTWKVVRKQKGQIIITAVWTLSNDGNTLTDDFTGIDRNGSAHTVKYLYKRSAGGSSFAATWVSVSGMMNSDFVLEVQAYDGDGLSFVVPSEAQTLSVKFDGKDYPYTGANAAEGAASSARRLNPRSLEITDKLNGKPTRKQQIEISSDLKTLTMTRRGVGQAEPNILVFDRRE